MAIDMSLIKIYAGEFMATLLFIFTICAMVLNLPPTVLPVVSGLIVALVALAVIYSFGDISGAHFNPAVTIGAMVGGKISPGRGLIYIALQIVAALIAVGLCAGLYGTANLKSLVLAPGPNASYVQAVLMEAVLTFILVFVIYATAMGVSVRPKPLSGDDTEAPETAEEFRDRQAAATAKLNFAPIAIAFTLGFLAYLGGSVSGGGFNPARALAPAIITLKLKDIWVYLVGDIIGGAAAALVYTFVFAR